MHAKTNMEKTGWNIKAGTVSFYSWYTVDINCHLIGLS